ncbi:hypothetical protein PR048_014223 [Dryococelus australis]|uniref:Uncharacterized protein n=1 Tax=Dryococelus australis TaxID=614101 RepID=A0ABQ9HDU8_9NEOP|nr:hypothetical protein PR048_014223 [Dryococelus australis]
MGNPRAIRESHVQHQSGVNIWMCVVGRQLTEPFELLERLNGDTYSNFIRRNLPPLLEDVNLEARINMWFQNGGAPCHYGVQVR